ncbi:MAG TPA: ACP S-malonyltransferase [Polyangiaceae bacterium]|jgi:[acyl-carrier-protein] S-malonyltransferase
MKLAFLFPGQGSQTVGMGKALAESSAEAAAIFRGADDALGFSLQKLCFEGPEAELTLTMNAQPAIVTVSSAVLAAIHAAHPSLPVPVYAAGHSLGEYGALVAAGALSLADAVRLVHLRGRAMQDAVPAGVGAMAAIIGGEAQAVSELCERAAQGEVVACANFNAPGQIVISGHKAAVVRASALAAEQKLKAIPLNVSAPFHCSLMAPAARAVETALGQIQIGPLAFPVIANTTAQANAEAAQVGKLLVRQIDSPVLWQQSVQAMAEAGVTHALEIGPGKVLAGLVKRIDKRVQVLSVSDAESIAKIPGFLS